MDQQIAHRTAQLQRERAAQAELSERAEAYTEPGHGVAALVAGGVAAKAGLFKGLFVAALAMKKFLIIGLIALVAVVKRFWSWMQGRNTARALDTLPPAA